MPRTSNGRGRSKAAQIHPRSSSTGRVQKGKQTNNAASTAIAQGSVCRDVIDPGLLHVSYCPPERSPYRTRQQTGASRSTSSQVQQQPSTSTTKTTATIPTSNEFEMLSGDENNNYDGGSSADDDDDDDDLSRKERKGKKCNSPKERRPPPIYVLDTLADDVDELLEGLEYCLKIGKSSVQVITLNKKNFDKVVKELKLNNFKFYTFDPVEKVPMKIVLQGYKDRPISDLEQNLADVKVKPREIKVLSRSTTVTGTHTLYLLFFDRGSVKIQDLRRIKSLDGFFVTWRFYTKNPTDAAQCHRCQKFGHGSRNCNLPPRCVKCGDTHFTEKCSLPRKDKLGDNAHQHKARVKCANCGENHTANFRGCVARKKYLEEQDKKNKSPASRLSPKTSSSSTAAAGGGAVQTNNIAFPPGWGGSYAKVTASGSGNPPGQADVSGEDLFTLPEFFALAGEMLTRFRACRNKAEQFQALSELMMKYIYNK